MIESLLFFGCPLIFFVGIMIGDFMADGYLERGDS